MRKYEVWHRITHEFYMGEIEANDKDEAEEKAIHDLPMSREMELYDENQEFIIEKMHDVVICDECGIETDEKEYVETQDGRELCFGCDSKRLIDEQ